MSEISNIPFQPLETMLAETSGTPLAKEESSALLQVTGSQRPFLLDYFAKEGSLTGKIIQTDQETLKIQVSISNAETLLDILDIKVPLDIAKDSSVTVKLLSSPSLLQPNQSVQSSQSHPLPVRIISVDGVPIKDFMAAKSSLSSASVEIFKLSPAPAVDFFPQINRIPFKVEVISMTNRSMEIVSPESNVENKGKIHVSVSNPNKEERVLLDQIETLPKNVSHETFRYQNINITPKDSLIVKIVKISSEGISIPEKPVIKVFVIESEDIGSLRDNSLSKEPAVSLPQQAQDSSKQQMFLQGKVLPETLDGKPLIQISKDLLLLFPKTMYLPPDTTLSLDIIEHIKVDIPPEPSFQRKFSSLDKLIGFLMQEVLKGQPLSQNVLSKLPSPLDNEKVLLSSLFKMIKNLPKGEMRGMFSPEEVAHIRDIPEKTSEIIQNLRNDVRQSTHLVVDNNGIQFKEITIPIVNQNVADFIKFYINNPPEEKEESRNKNYMKEKIRFVVECLLSELGFIQFDGLASRKNRTFELILRLEERFPAELDNELEKLFLEALHMMNYNGRLKIQRNTKILEFKKVEDGKNMISGILI